MLRRIFDKTFGIFMLVGLVNTAIGTAVMFLCYNVMHLSYWFSSASNYLVGSVVSYFLNKYVTFQVKDKGKAYLVRFVANISLCYLVAYGLARPCVRYLLLAAPRVQDNVSMVVGMCIFVGLNYLGQRFFVFHPVKDKG